VQGLLVVTPYYNKPPQAALEAHFTAVADATGLPMLIYDIPGRTGAAVASETLVRLAAHPRIVGVKDAKDAPGATSHVLAKTDLVYYCGTDMLNLPWLSLGAVGVISVVGHVVGDRLREMIDSFGAGDVTRARQIHYELVPVYDGMFRNQGAVMTKAALDLLGQPGGAVRAPLLAATDAERHQLTLDLTAGGVKLPGTAA
jgi:4-hydroxy-tetrahydrodipicolinate synthase